MIKPLLLVFCCAVSLNFGFTKVEKPNYDFSLDTLNDFFPDKTISELEKKYGKAEVVSEAGGIQTLKFQVPHIRYKFPVIVQSNGGVVVDFFARLPSYFLHDLFFQSLVNRYGKQSFYKRFGEEAVYDWDKAPLKHVYSAACTITCFPIFYSVYSTQKDIKPLIKKMKEASQAR